MSNADLPVLEEWRIIRVDDDLHLVGYVSGHPRIRDGARTVTSAVQELAEDHSWARTRSRVYRLGAAGKGPLPADWAEALDHYLAVAWGTKRSQDEPQ